jgi:hypothetical protein
VRTGATGRGSSFGPPDPRQSQRGSCRYGFLLQLPDGKTPVRPFLQQGQGYSQLGELAPGQKLAGAQKTLVQNLDIELQPAAVYGVFGLKPAAVFGS